MKRYLLVALLGIAVMLPWWRIDMVAPQYPQGLHVTTWFYTVTGDVNEVDELNHYIGFMPLARVAAIERHLSPFIGIAIIALLLLALRARGVWSYVLAAPAVLLPLVFVADLAAWLYYAGHHLDPHAALSSSVAPWTPSLLGGGGVGQFQTFSSFGGGFYLALATAILTLYCVNRRSHAQ